MAVKHVIKYYEQSCKDLKEFEDILKTVEKESQEGLFDPERLEMLKQQVIPLQENYERWSYMMYLLNKPTRKEKEAGYNRRVSKFLAKLNKKNSPDEIGQSNRSILTDLSKV